MQSYLEKMLSNSKGQDLIKKTRFGDIINGLQRGGAYAFDEESYRRFLPIAKQSGLPGLPDPDKFFS